MTLTRLARLALALATMASAFDVTLHALVGAPVLNNNQPVQTSGPTLTLSWTASATGTPTSYLIEVSSTPAGPANLASYNTGNAQTTLVAAGVVPGIYYVRVRGIDASGAGAPSNEVQLVVANSSLSAPVLNNNQPVLSSGPTLTLSWTSPVTGLPTSYLIETSTAPGGPANLANFNTGGVQTTIVAPGVPPGTYYVRVRGVDANGAGPVSNEVQVVVGTAGGGVCPSAPRGLTITAQTGGTMAFAWQPPLTGVPTSYVVQVGSAPGGANLANVDTNSAALTLSATDVPTGAYFVRIYARSTNCGAPSFLGPASNEILVSVGGTPGWRGQIECRAAITGPFGYQHNETQSWFVGGPGQVISSARTNYPVVWTARGSGGGTGGSWTIDSTAMTDLSATVVASTQIPLFDRTTAAILIRGGLVGTPVSFDLHEMDFPGFTAPSPSATLVTGTFSRPTAGGDSPQQPGGSTGTLSCTWSLRFQ